jgi:hypothetical protein
VVVNLVYGLLQDRANLIIVVGILGRGIGRKDIVVVVADFA